MIPEQFIDELIARSDIADVVSGYVRLIPKGGNMWGRCPFHGEKTPSFSVNRDKQIFKCFGCGKGGGVINFIMSIENMSYPEAIRFLAKRLGLEVPETDQRDAPQEKIRRAIEANTAAARFYRNYLTGPEGQSAREYLAQRKISPKFAARFGLGAAPGEWDTLTKVLTAKGFTTEELLDSGLVIQDSMGKVYDKFRSRLMFPVVDMRGDVVGFTSRLLPGLEGTRYLNSPDTICFKKGQLIYALNYAKNTKRPYLVLTQEVIDVITLHQAGFDNGICTIGTTLTADHARIIARYTRELVLCCDNDEAGKKATERAMEILEKADLKVRILQLSDDAEEADKPPKRGPDDFIKEFGPRAFGISETALAQKVERWRKSQRWKDWQCKDQAPCQPESRHLRYNNLRSALAEEGVLRLLVLDPTFFDRIDLTPEEFSCELLGRVYGLWQDAYDQGLDVQLSSLKGNLNRAELEQIAQIFSTPEPLVDADEAMEGYIRIIREEGTGGLVVAGLRRVLR